MELVEKIKGVLVAAFPPPATVNIEDDDRLEGIIGWVASPRFEGMEIIDRIDLLWGVLNKELTREERRRVVAIVAVTPFEEVAHSA